MKFLHGREKFTLYKDSLGARRRLSNSGPQRLVHVSVACGLFHMQLGV